jgi:glycosyltransferase involved in cell wall biosynthesis
MTDPVSDTPVLSIVIPAFNEANNVGPVVREVVEVLARRQMSSVELILVDDGSTDGTAAELQRLKAIFSCVAVVSHAVNRGFGAALRSGYQASRGQFVTLLTSDGEFDPEEVLDLFAAIGEDDLVLSRRIRGGVLSSQKRTLLSAGFSGMSRLLLGFDPSELMGIYVIRGPLVRELDLRSDTGLMNTELQMKCFARGCRVKYGSTRVRPRLSGESKVTGARAIARCFFEMVKLRARGVVAR